MAAGLAGGKEWAAKPEAEPVPELGVVESGMLLRAEAEHPQAIANAAGTTNACAGEGVISKGVEQLQLRDDKAGPVESTLHFGKVTQRGCKEIKW